MNHLIILGRQPELGLVELESRLGAAAMQPFGRSSALIARPINLNELGGAIKIGTIIYRGPSRDINEAPIDLETLPLREGKTTFGISYYGLHATPRFVAVTGITMKKRLKSRGSVRYVAPQTGTALTAAQVKFNGLVREGFELLVAISKQEMVVAITDQVQDIDWYAVRDYQRPTRSAKVGMLPPKLAQIMVNTTSTDVVYDPFCGTGVILQEALLMNRMAVGSDLAPEMVQATNDNLAWLDGIKPELPKWVVSEADARTVTLPNVPAAIVSEGYLGPNISSRPTQDTYATLSAELRPLFVDSLRNWATQLPPDAQVTITSPMWHTTAGWKGLGLIDLVSDLGYTLKRFKHVHGDSLTYRRPNQLVGRQLLILRKK